MTLIVYFAVVPVRWLLCVCGRVVEYLDTLRRMNGLKDASGIKWIVGV